MLRNPKLQIQPQEVPVSDLSILTQPTSRNTVASSDMAPDPSSGLDSGGVISQGFLEQLLLNSSCHDFEKVEKGQKMSNRLWLRIAGYIKYLSSTYVFISSFVSLTKYAGRKLKTVMWLRMAGKFMTTFFFANNMSSQRWLRIAGYL